MSIKKITSLLVCIAAVLSFAACTGADPEQSTADITSVVSPEDTSSPAGNDTDAVDVTSEVTTSADVTTESITTAVEITTADITTDPSAATSAPVDTTTEIPQVTTQTVPGTEVTDPSETTAAGTGPDVTGPSVPDPDAEKEAYYRTYYSSGDFGYAGDIKKVHMESDDRTFDFISSGTFFRFSGNAPGSYVSVAEKDGRFILTVSSAGENGAVSAQYYRSEKKEGESFSDFTADLGFDDLGTVNRDELTASEFNGEARIGGVLYDSVEITATQKIIDDDGKETGESFSVPFLVYVQPDTHKIFRFYMIEEYMTIGADGKIETSRELLSIDYLSEYAKDIPADAVFTDVSTSALTEFYQAALLAILLGA
jgi:hypothetical protein